MGRSIGPEPRSALDPWAKPFISTQSLLALLVLKESLSEVSEGPRATGSAGSEESKLTAGCRTRAGETAQDYKYEIGACGIAMGTTLDGTIFRSWMRRLSEAEAC